MGDGTAVVGLELDLSLARNVTGPLDDEIKARLRAVLENPTEETWGAAHSLVIGADRWMTLWQAVCEMDPSYSGIGPVIKTEGGKETARMQWRRIPDAGILLRAIRYATH